LAKHSSHPEAGSLAGHAVEGCWRAGTTSTHARWARTSWRWSARRRAGSRALRFHRRRCLRPFRRRRADRRCMHVRSDDQCPSVHVCCSIVPSCGRRG